MQLMGILNITPDSINRDGTMMSPADFLREADQLINNSAAIIDIGAQATNPWAEPISPEEEWNRLEPILPLLVEKFPGRISLDTFNHEVAEKALLIGKVILNDVTMFHDPRMIELAVQYQTKCVVSHLPPSANGDIRWAHQNPNINSDIEVLTDLLVKRRQMINAGVRPENIILDPGIGFGKTSACNRKLIEFAKHMKDTSLLASIDPECLNEPEIKVLIGVSQKRVVGEYFASDKDDPDAKKNDFANQRAFQIAERTGASILRLHKPELYRPTVRPSFLP